MTALAAEGKTQQRIGASEKTTTFTDEAEYGVAPYGNHAAQPLFLCFVQARSGASRKQGFEGAPLFFSAQGGGTRYNRRGKEREIKHDCGK